MGLSQKSPVHEFDRRFHKYTIRSSVFARALVRPQLLLAECRNGALRDQSRSYVWPISHLWERRVVLFDPFLGRIRCPGRKVYRALGQVCPSAGLHRVHIRARQRGYIPQTVIGPDSSTTSRRNGFCSLALVHPAQRRDAAVVVRHVGPAVLKKRIRYQYRMVGQCAPGVPWSPPQRRRLARAGGLTLLPCAHNATERQAGSGRVARHHHL